jgi:hypothetical protein
VKTVGQKREQRNDMGSLHATVDAQRASKFECRTCVFEIYTNEKEKKNSEPCYEVLGGCTKIRLVSDPVSAVKAEQCSKILFHSAKKSYPAIDFIYNDEKNHFHAFQTTIGSTPYKARAKGIKDLEDAIGDASKLTIYYAVPDFNFLDFVTDPVQPESLCKYVYLKIPNPSSTEGRLFEAAEQKLKMFYGLINNLTEDEIGAILLVRYKLKLPKRATKKEMVRMLEKAIGQQL